MLTLRIIRGALLGSALLACAAVATAQDNTALIDALVRKGILSDQEAEDLRADLANENAAALASTSKGPNLSKLTISGRFQAQYVGLDTNIENAADPAANHHFFLRRIYIGFKPVFTNGWSAYLNYDFAGSTFDAAYIEWAKNPLAVIQAGFKKAPIGYEEYFISSGALKSIERSPITRFFVEGNNGRRLGAGSYRQGLWLSGKKDNFSYEVAVTNPERLEGSSDVIGTGNASNNNLAYWGNANYNFLLGQSSAVPSTLKTGVSLGFLPDQGGKVLGAGNDLTVWSAYADFRRGPFSLMGEYFGSKNEQGVSAIRDSESSGFWIQPSYRFGAYEAVVRYTYVDSDGRGVQTSDGIRSAPSGGTMDVLSEWFVGLNWYLLGNEAKHDVKWQAGYIFGKSEDALNGSHAEANTKGFRSQLQVNF